MVLDRVVAKRHWDYPMNKINTVPITNHIMETNWIISITLKSIKLLDRLYNILINLPYVVRLSPSVFFYLITIVLSK
jgi:hypothetical protein